MLSQVLQESKKHSWHDVFSSSWVFDSRKRWRFAREYLWNLWTTSLLSQDQCHGSVSYFQDPAVSRHQYSSDWFKMVSDWKSAPPRSSKFLGVYFNRCKTTCFPSGPPELGPVDPDGALGALLGPCAGRWLNCSPHQEVLKSACITAARLKTFGRSEMNSADIFFGAFYMHAECRKQEHASSYVCRVQLIAVKPTHKCLPVDRPFHLETSIQICFAKHSLNHIGMAWVGILDQGAQGCAFCFAFSYIFLATQFWPISI